MGIAPKAPGRASSILGVRTALALITVLIGLAVPAGGKQAALASAETHTLTFFHTHTKESATFTFWRDGRYDDEALSRLNWFLRDWRVDEPAKMDPHLFDVLWEVYRESGSHEPINIISAYRSPRTNAMLRGRSKAVSEHSQHMLGKAMDIRLPDVDSARLRGIAMRMQYGGVGYYQSSDFVHVDTGNVRAWPRMSQDQLARLFPDGKTVHLPPSGKPLPRYEEARAEILARDRVLSSASGVRNPVSSLLASLFGRDGRSSQDGESSREITTASLPRELAEGASMSIPLPPQRPSGIVSLLNGAAPSDPAKPVGAGERPATAAVWTEASMLLFWSEPLGNARNPIGSPVQMLPASYLRSGSGTPSVPMTFTGEMAGRGEERRFSGSAIPRAAAFRVAQDF